MFPCDGSRYENVEEKVDYLICLLGNLLPVRANQNNGKK
jgi:hypothetical protein